MANWQWLNAHRVRTGMYASTDRQGFNGAFFFYGPKSEKVRVIASDGMGWQHVSVSLADKPNTTPNWALMCYVKDLFWEPEDCVVQFHPRASQYVNNHAGCLHLWRCTHRDFPEPDAIMVGIKNA